MSTLEGEKRKGDDVDCDVKKSKTDSVTSSGDSSMSIMCL